MPQGEPAIRSSRCEEAVDPRTNVGGALVAPLSRTRHADDALRASAQPTTPHRVPSTDFGAAQFRECTRGLTPRVSRPLIGRMRGEELLATLRNEARTGRPVAAVMRHAARHPIADPQRPEIAELTADGCAAAEAFGVQLGNFSRVRLFHSPVKRCQQTAECIARGVERVGGRVELLGPQAALGIDYIRDLAEAGRLTVQHGEHFVRLWFQGAVPAAVIDPAPALAAMKLDFVRTQLAAATPGMLDLHVSHDWNIIILREHLVGVRHEDAGWLTFLDGVAFRPAERGVRAVYREQVREIE